MDSLEIKETLKAGEYYLKQLRALDEEIKNAQKQITNTSNEAENSLLLRFSLVENKIKELIENRKLELLDKITKIKDRSFKPLADCELMIRSKIQETEDLIELGNEIQRKSNNVDIKCEKFEQKSSLLGSLPEIPALKEVPCIYFEYDESLEDELLDIISRNGKITRIAPVQICQLVEKPGSILVEWRIVDLEDKSMDIQEFCLQKATGDFSSDQVIFETSYKGSDTQFLVKDLKVNEIYSFRISCKFEGSSSFSRWSIPQKFKTKLKPFCWKDNTACFSMNSENQIATPIVDTPPILISNGPQFKVGHAIEFTLLEMEPNTMAYLGIVTDGKTRKLSTMEDNEGTFVLKSNGEITVDGSKKSTQLPHFQKGTQVTFTCEITLNKRIVIHIDLSDKRVTYEWYVDEEQCFYFAAELPTTKWKIMVE